MTRRTTLLARTAVGLVVATIATLAAAGNASISVSRQDVTAWVSDTKFQGDMALINKTPWEVISPDDLPRRIDADPVIATDRVLAAFDSKKAQVALYTRQGARLKKRAVVRPHSTARPTHYSLVAGEKHGGLGVEVYADGDRLQYTICVSGEGMVELKPAVVQQVTIDDCQLAYAVVPSFIGTDFVFDPSRFGDRRQLYVPSMNLLTGLVRGGDCTVIGVWPPGDQLVRLELEAADGERIIDGYSVSMAGRSFYLFLVEHPDIWHAEPLRAAYLEKDTVIGWKRPFEAWWIGNFFIKSEEIGYPFYFRARKEKLWGRFIRSWYYYPFWFDGDKTYVHFEKKFPPEGKLLIYFLEEPPNAPGILSPVEAVQVALGNETAGELLDLEGIEQRPLLAHGNAVCAMTNKVQELFDAGNEVRQRALIESRADDTADFIGMIRQRVFEFGDFAKQAKELLETGKRTAPDLAEALRPLEETIDEIAVVAREDLPEVSLEEVRRWTDEIKRLAAKIRPTNRERYKVLARQCRSVAGSQDDLARELSILTIRLTQQAAEFGVDSPERVRLTEEIIARSRRILRRPTWWEPRRHHLPKADPG